MTLGLPDDIDEEGGDLFKRNDVRETTSQSALLENKTSYLTIPGTGFLVERYDTVTSNIVIRSDHEGQIIEEGGDTQFFAPVNLPHNAVITGVVVYGSNTGDAAWELKRSNFTLNSGNDTMASGTTIGATEDTSISNATIDNQNYSYFIHVADLTGTIIAARITYTTNYD